MATRVTLTPAARSSDPLVVSKVQLTNDRGDRRAESAWLEQAARPGIVRLVSTSNEPFTIVTEHAGAKTLRTGNLDPDAALAVLTDVTNTLAGLHRDGLVHGKLTVDHIVLGSDRTWLCSPDGHAANPSHDLDALARIMQELAHQWDESGNRTPWRDQWNEIADRLERGEDPSRSAKRALQALGRLALTEDDTTTRTANRTIDWRAPLRFRGLLTLTAAVVLAFGGLALVSNSSTTEPGGPRITIDGATYAVGSHGDDVAVLDTPCDPRARVLVLTRSSATVWAFDSVGDGMRAVPVAVVPGATDIRAERIGEADNRCDVAVARGPAGAVVVDVGGR